MAKFIRFLGPDGPTYGRVEDDVVYTLSGDLFGWWEETGEGFLLDGLKLLPPCSPGKMLAVGFNYRDHAEEFHTPIGRPWAEGPLSPCPDPAGRV